MLVNHWVNKMLFFVSVCRPIYFFFHVFCRSWTKRRNAATASALSRWLGSNPCNFSPTPVWWLNDSRITETLGSFFCFLKKEPSESWFFLFSDSFGLLYRDTVWVLDELPECEGVHSSSEPPKPWPLFPLPCSSSEDLGDDPGGDGYTFFRAVCLSGVSLICNERITFIISVSADINTFSRT